MQPRVVTIQAQILEMINELKAKLNTSIILITHDLGVVCETCDEVAVIYAGKIVEHASKWDLFKHPAHPYTIGLFKSLPRINEDIDRLSPISGFPPDPSKLPEGCAFHPRCQYDTDVCRSGDVPLFEIASGHFCRCYKNQHES
jgi:peptide/nickel transport system ATP-binding protein